MKWLLIRLLGLLTFATVVVGIGAAIIAYDGEQGPLTGIARSSLVGAVFWGLAAMFDSWSTKIKRSLPPRGWVPPKAPKEAKAKALPIKPTHAAPQPHRAKPRRFAPPPVAQAIDPSLEAASPSLPSHLRHFIEAGEQSIHTPQKSKAGDQAKIVPDKHAADRGRFIPPE